jgi:mycoredoxin
MTPESASGDSMTEAHLVVYGTLWCGDCRRACQYLDEHAIAYCWVDVDQDGEAVALVKELNRGNRSVPTLVFPDGAILVEPSRLQLARRFGLDA